MSDEFGDRMKLYEGVEADRRLIPLLPAIARIDGRCFHSYCRGRERPYDKRLSDTMIDVTEFLAFESGAAAGYTQSDEITLAWSSDTFKSQIFFGGRIQKMVSILAAMASVRFNRLMEVLLPEKRETEAVFDCRVWNVPNRTEAANVFLWRENDAVKNSVTMAARCHYSDAALFEKGRAEKNEMLFAKGINWNDYPEFFKRGTYIVRRKAIRKFTPDEISVLPERHAARTNRELEIERTEYRRMQMPPFGKVLNREAVLFEGAEPVTARTEE